MALTYCEVCGVLIKGSGADAPQGVICDGCFDSRQVMVESAGELLRAEPVVATPEKVQFACPYCAAVLRVALPKGERTHVRCPRCSETFYAEGDGKVAARMEGNTTQVLLQADVLPDLTPPGGGRAMDTGTQPLRPLRSDATQPMRSLRADGTRPLRPLEPAAGAQFELRPTGEPGPSARDTAALRASDEGRIALDADALRAKTQRFGDGRKTGRTGTGRTATGRTETGRAATGAKKGGTDRIPRPAAEAPAVETPLAKRTGKVPARKRASERLRNVSSGAIKRAVAKAEELETEQEKRLLRTIGAWLLVLAPALVCGFLAHLASRDAGLVEANKPAGRLLRTTGLQGDRALRAMNGLLPPEQRLPGLSLERPAERARGDAATVDSSQGR